MFCYQCEQTAKSTGCTVTGVCGKDPHIAALQDLLTHMAKCTARRLDISDADQETRREGQLFILEALFSTVTNVNFDADRLRAMLQRGVQFVSKLPEGDEHGCIAKHGIPENEEDTIQKAEALRIDTRAGKLGEDVTGLQELILYGLKGAAAYAHHAHVLGIDDQDLLNEFSDIAGYLASDPEDISDLTAKALHVGEINLRAMELLDQANTQAYGHPEPTEIRVSPVAGKCILVSGHDLKDLDLLLQQTEGKGINVYTHGEMLPANTYAGLKKYSHLVGNYGGAWQDQRQEFNSFPGAILMTTNCIQKPADSYNDRIFTSGLVAWPGVKHIDNGDFTPVIEAALAAEGFAQDEPEQTITAGFGRNAVMSVAGTVIDAVKAGSIRHFFLIGGCDGAKPGRNYYTELAEQVPDDCVILTLACGKFRFNKLPFGDIGGIPRLLDIGQCNDAWSAVQIAVALAGAFECGVNDLPLSLVLSWYEQKAVAILLSLLHLGIKDIRVGPTLPAFVTPAVLQVLVDNFAIKPVTTPADDLDAILNN